MKFNSDKTSSFMQSSQATPKYQVSDGKNSKRQEENLLEKLCGPLGQTFGDETPKAEQKKESEDGDFSLGNSSIMINLEEAQDEEVKGPQQCLSKTEQDQIYSALNEPFLMKSSEE